MISSTLCYIRRNKKTLMLHRNKNKNDIHQGKWNGVGGKFEYGETPEECATREIKEETGLIVEKLRLKGIITCPEFKGNEDWRVFVFVVEKFSGKLEECQEGDLKWIRDSELLGLNLWEGDRLFFDWIKKDKFFSAKFIYKKGRLKEYEVVFY